MKIKFFKKHMNFSLLSLCILFGLLWSSCEKQPNKTNNLPYANIDAFLASKAPATQSFNIDPTIVQTITGIDGTKIKFFANSFKDGGGNLVTSTVKIELKEVFSKGDMILENKMTESNGNLLESGGEFYLKATSAGQNVFLNQAYQMIVPISAATSNPNAMELFVWLETQQDSFTWIPADSSWVNVDSSSSTIPYPNYNFYFDSLNWINCDYFWGVGIPKTTVTITPISTNSSLTNVSAYLVFNSINSVLKTYGSTISNVPIGQAVTVVVIGMDDSQFYLGTQNVTISNSLSVQITMSEATENQIINTINSL